LYLQTSKQQARFREGAVGSYDSLHFIQGFGCSPKLGQYDGPLHMHGNSPGLPTFAFVKVRQCFPISALTQEQRSTVEARADAACIGLEPLRETFDGAIDVTGIHGIDAQAKPFLNGLRLGTTGPEEQSNDNPTTMNHAVIYGTDHQPTKPCSFLRPTVCIVLREIFSSTLGVP
jgi:hypothetical protein